VGGEQKNKSSDCRFESDLGNAVEEGMFEKGVLYRRGILLLDLPKFLGVFFYY